jgi:hypothetical protein
MNETELHLAELEARIAMLEDAIATMQQAGMSMAQGGIAFARTADGLNAKIDALEKRAIRRLEMVEEAVWTIDNGSKPAPEPETVTISKADWDTTQERVGNAINALYDVLKLLSRGAETVEIEAVCNVALEADGDYEVKLGM